MFAFSESQKMKVASSSQKRFDVISSAVRSALGRLDKESATVEVNTHSLSLNVPVQGAGYTVEICILVPVVPLEECRVVTFPQVP